MRKIAVELLLANHDQSCPTCPKSATCELQELARRLGVDEVRFKPTQQAVADRPLLARRWCATRTSASSAATACGCARRSRAIGAIDFAHRGSERAVLPAFGKDLGEVECVNCGQCAAVCPTGALTPAFGGRGGLEGARRSRRRRSWRRSPRRCAWPSARRSACRRARSTTGQIVAALQARSASTRSTTPASPPT